jgi:hypothetical protein
MDSISFEITKLTCDPAEPTAGQFFRLMVELEQNAPVDIAVLLEKQRIVRSVGGQPELIPTGQEYFELDPQPIKVDGGKRQGISEPIQVRRHAQAEAGDPPVRFPEQLLFTAFGRPATRFRSEVAFISGSPPEGS